MKKLLTRALVSCSLLFAGPALAQAQGPLPPPSIVPGVATCQPPAADGSVACVIRYDVSGQVGTFDLGVSAQDAVGNNSLMIPTVSFTVDAAGPTFIPGTPTQIRDVGKVYVDLPVTIKDSAGIAVGTVIGVGTRR